MQFTSVSGEMPKTLPPSEHTARILEIIERQLALLEQLTTTRIFVPYGTKIGGV